MNPKITQQGAPAGQEPARDGGVRPATPATGTINRETSALHRMGTLAVHWGWRDTVPGFPDRLRENPPRQGFFEHPEHLAVRAHLPAPWQDILDLAYYSGWRKNEILGLTWDEIDEAGGVIRLSPARSKTFWWGGFSRRARTQAQRDRRPTSPAIGRGGLLDGSEQVTVEEPDDPSLEFRGPVVEERDVTEVGVARRAVHLIAFCPFRFSAQNLFIRVDTAFRAAADIVRLVFPAFLAAPTCRRTLPPTAPRALSSADIWRSIWLFSFWSCVSAFLSIFETSANGSPFEHAVLQPGLEL